MNKSGFSLYVTIIFMLIFTSLITALIFHLQVVTSDINLFEEINERAKKEAELKTCIVDLSCVQKQELQSNQEAIVDYLQSEGKMIITSEQADDLMDELYAISGEEKLWLIRNEETLVIGENEHIVYRLSIRN